MRRSAAAGAALLLALAAGGGGAGAAAQEPLAPIVFATAGGGVLGALAGGATGWVVGSGGHDDGYISASEALGVIGVAIGYPLGAAIGARLAATTDDGARPRLAPLVLVSALAAIAGGFVWNGVGEAYERPDSMDSWHIGAVLGVTTHVLVTSLAAQRARPVKPAPVPAPDDPGPP